MRLMSFAVVAVAVSFAQQTALAADTPVGHWHGTYDCQQVTATADVDIWPDDSAPSGMSGRFAFSPGPTGQGATGSYWIAVEGQPGGWKLVPVQWQNQPEGYDMAAASVFLIRDNLRGLIEHPACMGNARVISLNYTGETTMTAATQAPDAPSAPGASNPGTTGWQKPDYMIRAEEERKAQNKANCERASQGANVYCEHN